MDDTAREWLIESQLVTMRHGVDAPICKETCEHLVAKDNLQLHTRAIDDVLGCIHSDGCTVTT